jgi:predicted nucleic acid-binding Zn ribbon protein
MIQKFSDPPLTKCEGCGGLLKKILSAPALVFKGSGFYITDYSQKGKEKSEKPASGTDQTTKEKPKESSPTTTTPTTSKTPASPSKPNPE